MMKRIQSSFGRKTWLALMTCILAGGVVLVYLLWLPQNQSSAATSTPDYQTFTVRNGEISISASGSASLAAASTQDLNFTTQGTIAQILVQTGDTVKAGQVLATLAEIDELKVAVASRQVELDTAQKALDDLKSEKNQRLSQALIDRAAAYQTYQDAKDHLLKKGQGRCNTNTTETYYFEYLYAKMRVDQWQGYLDDSKTGYGTNYILARLRPMTSEMNRANINYLYCLSYTDQEVLNSEVNWMTSEANFNLLDAAYKDLAANAGIDPSELAIAEARVTNAVHQFAQAQKALDGATLRAPVDGTVTAVNGLVGDTVGGAAISTSALITVSDLAHPVLTFNLDESDFENIQVGCPVEATFQAISGKTFTGKVSQIDPSLATVRNVEYVHGLITLNEDLPTQELTIASGMSAFIDVNCRQASNVLIIPSDALRQVTGSSASVFVLTPTGETEKRAVEIGLRTTAFAEIRSGLSAGEKVIINSANLK